MNGKLIFCKDSILRFCSVYDEKNLIPLNCLEDSENEFKTLLKYLNKTIMIQEETTLGSIIISLEPWKNAIKELLGNNIESYIKEIKNISIMHDEFEWINISKKTEVTTNYKNENLGFFKIKSNFEICGYKYNDNNDFSIATDIHKLKNVPVIFTKKNYIIGKKNTTEKDMFLNKSISGFFERENHYFIKDESSTITLYDFLETIFKNGLIYNDPIDQDNTFEGLDDLLKNETYINNIETQLIDKNDNKEIENDKLEEWKKIINNVELKDSFNIITETIKEAEPKIERLYNYNLTKNERIK